MNDFWNKEKDVQWANDEKKRRQKTGGMELNHEHNIKKTTKDVLKDEN